jgi:hypothetical protein
MVKSEVAIVNLHKSFASTLIIAFIIICFFVLDYKIISYLNSYISKLHKIYIINYETLSYIWGELDEERIYKPRWKIEIKQDT